MGETRKEYRSNNGSANFKESQVHATIQILILDGVESTSWEWSEADEGLR